MNAMGQGFDAEYHPNNERVKVYAKRFEKYKKLGDFIETVSVNNEKRTMNN